MADLRKRAFVCGHPVAHSRSPLIHGHWLRRFGIDGSYEAVDVAPADLDAFLDSAREGRYVGGNITVPHKEVALSAIDRADEAAIRIGAVNTVWTEGGRLLGMNTDWLGFLASMDEQAPGWDRIRHAVVLGAGGAARGVVHALSSRAIASVTLVNRTREKAELLARSYASARAASWADLPEVLADAQLLVNTTSLGMTGKEPLDVDLAPMPREATVSDIVYAPLTTPLLAGARLRGMRCVDGLGMLLHQAVPGFEKWFKVRPEVSRELRELVVADLESRS